MDCESSLFPYIVYLEVHFGPRNLIFFVCHFLIDFSLFPFAASDWVKR